MGPRPTKIILGKKVGRLTLSNLKTCYKAAVIKTTWYWNKYRHTGQWNRIENAGNNPNISGKMIKYISSEYKW